MASFLGFLPPVISFLIGVTVLRSGSLDAVWSLGQLSGTVRGILTFLHMVNMGILVLAKMNGDRQAVLDIKKRQINSHLTPMLEQLNVDVSPDVRGHIRAIVFEYKGKGLRVVAHHGAYSFEELQAVWEPGQGVCGQCYKDGADIFCDLSPVRNAPGYPSLKMDPETDSYRLTPDQYVLTRDVRWVTAFLLEDANGHPWGVLCLDSKVCEISEKDKLEIAKKVRVYREVINICWNA